MTDTNFVALIKQLALDPEQEMALSRILEALLTELQAQRDRIERLEWIAKGGSPQGRVRPEDRTR